MEGEGGRVFQGVVCERVFGVLGRGPGAEDSDQLKLRARGGGIGRGGTRSPVQ